MNDVQFIPHPKNDFLYRNSHIVHSFAAVNLFCLQLLNPLQH